jgi:hypothetical protein
MFKTKDEKTDKDFNLLELPLVDNSKSIITPLMIKLILILIFIIVIFLILGATVFTLVSQLNIIKGLTSQVQDLSTQIIGDIPLLRGKVDNLILLTNQINKVELLLTEKDKEIQSLKAITNNLISSVYNFENLDKLYFFENDKNFKIFWENMKKLNFLKDFNVEKINSLEKELKHNRDEIILLKDKIKSLNLIDNNINFKFNNSDENIIPIKPDKPDKLDDINNKIIENNENFKKFISLSDKVNKMEIEQNNYLENFESFKKIKPDLTNYKIKININNSDNEDKELYLCPDNNNISNNLEYFEHILITDKNIENKCTWNISQFGNFFEFENIVDKCKIQIKENEVVCSNEFDHTKTIFTLEQGSNDKYFKIKNVESGQYLFLDINKESDLSYFISLTKNKNIASEFNFLK